MNRISGLLQNYEELFVVTLVESAFAGMVIWTSVTLFNALVSIDQVAARALSSGAF